MRWDSQSVAGGRIVVVGDVGLDLYFDVGACVAPDEKSYSVRSLRHVGGTGANAAATIGALGGAPALVAAVGSDRFGSLVCELMRERSLSTDHLRVISGSTMIAVVWLRGGKREVVVDRGVADDESWSGFKTTTTSADLVYVSGAPLRVVERALRDAGSTPVVVGIEARQVNHSTAKAWVSVWRACRLLVTNLAGQEALTAVGAWPEAQSGWPGPAAITMGREGVAFMASRDDAVRVRALPVVSVDATGAGDVFAGAVCYFMSCGVPVLDSIRLGAAAAGLSTRKLGSQAALPSREQVLDAAHDLGDCEEMRPL